VVAPEVNWGEILDKAKNRALGSGGAGATAMVIQVCSLMWMRTIMNYQVNFLTNLVLWVLSVKTPFIRTIWEKKNNLRI
jgi:hypothetical protein